jgi:hypothetical protein
MVQHISDIFDTLRLGFSDTLPTLILESANVSLSDMIAYMYTVGLTQASRCGVPAMDELVTSATEGVGAKVQNFVNHAKATIVDDKLKPMVRRACIFGIDFYLSIPTYRYMCMVACSIFSVMGRAVFHFFEHVGFGLSVSAHQVQLFKVTSEEILTEGQVKGFGFRDPLSFTNHILIDIRISVAHHVSVLSVSTAPLQIHR